MMFLHLLVPHHHHSDGAEAVHMVKHECEDGHEHQHHAVDLFFSFLYHIDEVESFELNVSDDNGPIAWVNAYVNYSYEQLWFVNPQSERANPPPNISWFSIYHADSHGLRGPPLA